MDLESITESDIRDAIARWGSLHEHTTPDNDREFLIHEKDHYDIGDIARIIDTESTGSTSTDTLNPHALAQRATELGFTVVAARSSSGKKPAPHFGHIPGIEPKHRFSSRREAHLLGIHRALQGGITGTGKEGAESIVVSGGYEDDDDQSSFIIYTGHGGRDDSGKQYRDQSFNDPGNAALRTSKLTGRPVRVIRGANRKDPNPHLPKSGLRYDGLFTVEDFWHERGISGFQVCRFALAALDDDVPQPTGTAQKRAPDGNRTPGRRHRTSHQVARISEIAQHVKDAYKFQCQACRNTLMINDYPYAEGAHIRGVGEPHNGPDEIDNMLCLCPNCHVQFDNGAITVDEDMNLFRNGEHEGKLLTTPSCLPSPVHLKYHHRTRNPNYPLPDYS